MNDDRPTITEAYARSIRSADLKVEPDERGDVDLVIAAGFAGRAEGDSLGGHLYRLRAEFDATKGEIDHGHRSTRWLHREADQCERAASDGLDQVRRRPLEDKHAQRVAALDAELRARELRSRAKQHRIDASQAGVMSRGLALISLKTLPAARASLGAFAALAATRKMVMVDDHGVLSTAGKALGYWLDPLCTSCEGRGFNGGYLAPKVFCTDCRGSGHRRVSLGPTATMERFGQYLLAEMDRKTERIARRVKRAVLSTRRASEQPAEVADLQERLRGLRSTEAQED